MLWARQAGACAWCHEPLKDEAARHHRKRRRDGGDRYSNVLLLHPFCHDDCHRMPAAARALGVICPTTEDPEDWPWMDAAGNPWLLHDDGGKHRVAAHPDR